MVSFANLGNDIDGSEEQEPEPWWRCCCPKKKRREPVKSTKRLRSRRGSIKQAETNLEDVSEGLTDEAKAEIKPEFLPLTFVPDFIISEIFEKRYLKDVPYAVNSKVILLMADVCGFTSLCESYCQKGVSGIEELASVLNGFMSTLSAMLLEGGGDILNFAGDAFLVQWIEEGGRNGMRKAAKKAFDCAIALQTHQCLQTKNLDGTLKIKVGIALGEVSKWILGSEEFLLFVAAGPSIPSVQKAEDLCSPGEIIIDENFFKLLKEQEEKTFTPVQLTGGYVKVTKYPGAKGDEEPVPDRIELFEKCDDQHISMARIFLIPALRDLKSADELSYVSELTMVTILFIALLNVDVAQPQVLDSSFDVILASVRNHEAECELISIPGVLNKMLLFDKGCTFLVAFGLPGLKHSNDAARGILCADEISEKLRKIDIQASIGVSTGTCYCGIVGHPQRQEYTVIGNRVNMAARIMVVYNDQPIALNTETYHLSRDELGEGNFVELPSRKMKGIEGAGAIFAYRKKLTRKSSSDTKFDMVEDSNLHGSEVEKQKIRQCLLALCDDKKRKEMKEKTLLPVIIIKGQSSGGKSYMLYFTVDAAIDIGYKFAVCCAIPSFSKEPFSIISRLIQRMLEMTKKESSLDRENTLLSNLPSSTYSDLYLLNHLFDCEFPIPERTATDLKQRNDKIINILKTMILKFCRDHNSLILVDNADFMDDQSWYILHQLAEEEKILIVLSLSLDFKEINTSASVLLLKAYMHINMESSQEDYFAPLLCWFLGVQAVHTALFVYLKDITNGKAHLLKEISLSHAISRIIKIVPLESIDKERIEKEFYVEKFMALHHDKPMACELKHGVNLKHAMIPTNINDAVKESLNQLSIQDRLLLKRASVLGADFDLHALECISTGMRREEVLQSVHNLLTNHIFASVCSLENMVETSSSSLPTVALRFRNTCPCFAVYLKTHMKHLKASEWPIGPYHRLRFRTQEFRTCMLSYMTKEQVYKMRMEVADNLESNGPECASCKSKRVERADSSSTMLKQKRSYSVALTQCTCLEERTKLYSEIAFLYCTLGMVFLPAYYKKKAAQAANNINFPVQALFYIQNAFEIMPKYWLMSEEEKSPEEAHFDGVVLEVSLKKTQAEAFLLLGDTYSAASYAFQGLEMLGMDAVCFHGVFNAREFKKVLPKFKLLHAEYITKLIGVLVKAYLKAHFFKLTVDLLKIQYVALKCYPIDFIQVLSHMISLYQYKYLVREKEKLTELENNTFKLCREKLRNFNVLMDLTEINALGSAYAVIIEVNLVLGQLTRAENTANEAIKVLQMVNYKGPLPIIRVYQSLVHYYTEQYADCSRAVFALGKMEVASKSRKYRALYVSCLSLFLMKSLEGIHKTEIQFYHDKCNAFASAWNEKSSKIMSNDLAFFVSVVMTTWGLYADEHTNYIATKNVYQKCYEIAIALHKTLNKSKHNFWIVSGIMMMLEMQLRSIEKNIDLPTNIDLIEEYVSIQNTVKIVRYFMNSSKVEIPLILFHHLIAETISFLTEIIYLKDKMKFDYPIFKGDYQDLASIFEETKKKIIENT